MRIRHYVKRDLFISGLVGQMASGCSAGPIESASLTTTPTSQTTVSETAGSSTTSGTTETGVSTTETGVLTDVGDAFADAVVSFEPGDGAGFGAEVMPDVVLGPPLGGGAYSGNADVVSLGDGGVVVLALLDIGLVDGQGVDLLIFENPFPGWIELGEVAVSEDGVTWVTFPCDPYDEVQGYPGCAGINPVLSHPDNGIDATDPDVAGGDAFDLAQIGVKRARFVRITDTGTNTYDGTSGGFDLDALAVVNGEVID